MMLMAHTCSIINESLDLTLFLISNDKSNTVIIIIHVNKIFCHDYDFYFTECGGKLSNEASNKIHVPVYIFPSRRSNNFNSNDNNVLEAPREGGLCSRKKNAP